MPLNVPSTTLAQAPVLFAYVATNLGVAAWVFPSNRAQTVLNWPSSNTRQIVILNTGNNPLLFGLISYPDGGSFPNGGGLGIPYELGPAYPFSTGPGPVPVEGDNCTRIPAGASFSLDLLPYQERGNFVPISPNVVGYATVGKTAFPTYLIFFSSVGGNTTADLTYVNKFGTF